MQTIYTNKDIVGKGYRVSKIYSTAGGSSVSRGCGYGEPFYPVLSVYSKSYAGLTVIGDKEWAKRWQDLGISKDCTNDEAVDRFISEMVVAALTPSNFIEVMDGARKAGEVRGEYMGREKMQSELRRMLGLA